VSTLHRYSSVKTSFLRKLQEQRLSFTSAETDTCLKCCEGIN